MLTSRHLATIRAALLYWQEEICPHGEAAARPYLAPPDAPVLTSAEVGPMREALASNIRYAIYDPSRECLDGAELFTLHEEATQAAGDLGVATVIVPAKTGHPA